MSDPNRFDQYKQKLLHYWGVFLAFCGRLWEKVKVFSLSAVDFLRRNAVILGRYGKRLVQILASWLLQAREWCIAVTERLRKPAAEEAAELPAPEKTSEVPALPEAQVQIAEAEAAQPEQTAEEVPAAETEEAPAVQVQKNAPAWKSNPALVKTAAVFAAIGAGVKFVIKWICKLYKLILAAPVVWAAVKFAMENMERLPEEVGLDIQSTGEFARMISRQEAVYWPLGITMFCLLLMFCAKKPILPWVISIFTLVLPWLIWLLNYYA